MMFVEPLISYLGMLCMQSLLFCFLGKLKSSFVFLKFKIQHSSEKLTQHMT